MWVCRQKPLCMTAHTHVCYRRQESGVRGCSFRLSGLWLAYVSANECASTCATQKQAIIRCHGSCYGDCADMCFELFGVRCHGLLSRCPRVAHSCPFQKRAFAVTIAAAVHVLYLCAHTHVCCAKIRLQFLGIPVAALTVSSDAVQNAPPFSLMAL